MGYDGGGAALLYFHNRKKKCSTYVPPDVSGMAGLIPKIRPGGRGLSPEYLFGEPGSHLDCGFQARRELDYYGNNNPILRENPVGIRLDSWVVLQKAEVRLGESKWYDGATFAYFSTEASFDTIPGDGP